jgi:RimJ/RimL family protein N-acetyltransferase
MDNVQIGSRDRRQVVTDSTHPITSSCVPADAAQLCGTLTLRDGTVVQVRPIQPDDTERLQAFHARLSPETIEYRYFGPVPVLTAERAERLTHLDYARRMALVATTDTGTNDEQIVAVVRYEGLDQTTAEVAFVVEDPWQGHGIATQLLYRLALYAHQHGYSALVAEIMGSNYRMREVISHAGFPYTTRYVSGSVEMQFDISASPTAPFAPLMEGAACPRWR